MRDPEKKKQRDYDKQRRITSEYPKTQRHGKWRKNRRRPAQQVVRQRERVIGLAADVADPGFDPGAIVRPRARRWGASTLRDVIAWKRARRQRRSR